MHAQIQKPSAAHFTRGIARTFALNKFRSRISEAASPKRCCSHVALLTARPRRSEARPRQTGYARKIRTVGLYECWSDPAPKIFPLLATVSCDSLEWYESPRNPEPRVRYKMTAGIERPLLSHAGIWAPGTNWAI